MTQRGQKARKIELVIDDPDVWARIDAELSDSNEGADLKALGLLLERLAPWRDAKAVQRDLSAWAAKHEWQVPGDGIAGVAAELEKMGRESPRLASDRRAGVVLGMFLNVAATGDAADDRWRLDRLAGRAVPKRSLRRYWKDHSDPDQRVIAMRVAYDRIIRLADMQGLMAAGRSRKAASEWLRTNPGKHWTDAPPPRRPQAGP